MSSGVVYSPLLQVDTESSKAQAETELEDKVLPVVVHTDDVDEDEESDVVIMPMPKHSYTEENFKSREHQALIKSGRCESFGINSSKVADYEIANSPVKQPISSSVDKKPMGIRRSVERESLIGIRNSLLGKQQKNSIFASQTGAAMWRREIGGSVYEASEDEGILKQSTSKLVADKYIKTSIEYKTMLRLTKPCAVIVFWLFLIVAPLVLRYAMAARFLTLSEFSEEYVTGNATIIMNVPWTSCETCQAANGKGVTLHNMTVTVNNITGLMSQSSTFSEGFPSIAIFASHDFKSWYNFYSPPHVNMANVESYDHTEFFLNQSTGAACLGNVAVTYLVVCLNNYYYANSLKKGDFVAPPPFNDRCTQVYGQCGVPCADLKNSKYPSYCPNGVISYDYLSNTNATAASAKFSQPQVISWFYGLTILDWMVIIAIILDTFSNILRFLPLLSGGPTELHKDSNRVVVVTGRAVLVNASPFAGEKEGIFLRSLIGRTATALHTAGSRHNIRALYIDAIVNEDCTNMARYQQWKAWIDFIQFLCTFKTEDMKWKESWRKANPNAPKRIVTVGQGESKIYQCDPNAVDFEGYKDYSGDSISETDYSRHLSAECIASRDMSKAKKMNQIDILPALCFLDGWLESIKDSESSFPNYNNNDSCMLAVQCVFNAAPCHKYFDDENYLKIHSELEKLSSAFAKPVPKAPRARIYRDFKKEYCWRISKGDEMPTVDIAWVYFTRSKIDGEEAYQLSNCTKKITNSIVYVKPSRAKKNINPLLLWLGAREKTYQITKIENRATSSDPLCTIAVWPPVSDDEKSEPGKAIKSSEKVKSWSDMLAAASVFFDQKQVITSAAGAKEIVVQMSQLELICSNRGKAGALNTFLEYSRLRSDLWCYVTGHDGLNDPIQLLFGIVDARHMLAEPEVFWNESIPFFSRNRQTGAHTKNLGEINTSVILVQYPQYFSNVGDDDYLDNKNSAYYMIWQTLRDCSKTITSSGTNGIWDASDSNFKIATCCRIEDTATTQEYLDKYFTVHLPFFVAHGIAKDTEDYIEAVYRWSTGAVELFWSTIFDNNKLFHFMVIGQIFLIFMVASVVPSVYAYFAWLLLIVCIGFSGFCEKRYSRRPFRFLNVSATIVLNTMYWISNFISIVWLVLVPISISFLQTAPLASTAGQALTWSFVALALRLPPAVLTDQVIAMARFLNPYVRKYNFNLFLWRSSQLYACSFAYSLLSFLCGSLSSLNALLYYQDNTFWASFKNKDGKFLVAVMNAIRSPDFLTRMFAISLVLLQVLCIFGAVALEFSNSFLVLMTVLVCGFNIVLVMDIAMLLFPSMSNVSIFRPEYAFAGFGVVCIAVAIVGGYVPENTLWYIVQHA